MHSSFQLARKFIGYYFNAKNSKGHGIHSPFVFDFVKNVLNDKRSYPCYSKIEEKRKQLLNDNTVIAVEDFGAGSAVIPFKTRKVKAIAASSLKHKKFAQLLYRIAKYYQPKNIVELGTSFGISTSYLASASSATTVYTMEGAASIASIAQQTFDKLDLNNVELLRGSFDKILPALFEQLEYINLLFVDGNHRRDATLKYFYEALKKSKPSSIFIFDDIHWSIEMEEAWQEIKSHPSVSLTIDLFFIGIVFFSRDFKVKQDFAIRF
ncbi:MAG: class I SAM-dependent methyltransferase [Ginsengibacter sp.]